MTANTFFEVFNHFLSTQDSDEISKFASDIQCFKSESFGDGSFVHGAEAPSAFRLTLNKIKKSKTKSSMKVVSRSGNVKTAVFVVDIKQGSKTSKSVMSLGVVKQQLLYFIEAVN